MQVGTRVRVKQSALKADIRKRLDEDQESVLDTVSYLSSLNGVEGNIEGFWPTDEAPQGTLHVKWDPDQEEWRDYFNGDEGPIYGWYEDELEVIE